MGRLTFKKAVILGATGPTGIHLTRALQEYGLALRVVSRSQDKLEHYFGSTPAERVAADLSSAEATARAIDGCDLVFDCIGLPAERMHEHAVTARNIAAAVGKTGARCVQVSSYWAYLPLRHLPLSEQHPRTGGSDWVQQRREAEDILQQAGAAILNLPDFYGPYVHTSTLQQALNDAVRGKAMNWIGAADTEREYVYVPDAMALAAELATYDQAYGERWIIPGGGPFTGHQVADIVSRILGRPVKVRATGLTMLRMVSLFNKPLRGFMQMVPEYLKPIRYDASKLENLIGKPATTGYEEGIRQTLEWLMSTK